MSLLTEVLRKDGILLDIFSDCGGSVARFL